MRIGRVWCFVLLFSFAGGGSAFGQIATGIPPFSSNSASSFDTVDNANLNIHFSIPIVAKGRPSNRGWRRHRLVMSAIRARINYPNGER